LTCECAFRHSGVQFLMSPLSTYLRTRRFNRPTFGLTRHTNHWKNTAFRDFSNIWRGRIFFLLTFWLLLLLSTDLTFWLLLLLSTDLTTRLLLFNSPYCRKFLFKLPSISMKVYGISKVQTHGRQGVCTLNTLNPLNTTEKFALEMVASAELGGLQASYHWKELGWARCRKGSSGNRWRCLSGRNW